MVTFLNCSLIFMRDSGDNPFLRYLQPRNEIFVGDIIGRIDGYPSFFWLTPMRLFLIVATINLVYWYLLAKVGIWVNNQIIELSL